MSKYVVDSLQMISLADAIREKGGTSASMTFPDGMISAISDIQTGGGEESWAFDRKRLIKTEYDVGTGKSVVFSHYIVIGPELDSQSLTQSDGTQVIVYDTNTQETIHYFTYDNATSSFWGTQLTTEGDMIFFTYQYNNSNVGYFVWIYHANNDTWSFYDNEPSHLIDILGRQGSAYSLYKGKDFGIILSNYSPYCIQVDGTVTKLAQSPYQTSVRLYQDYVDSGNYKYIGVSMYSSSYSYNTSGYYKVIKANQNNELLNIVTIREGQTGTSRGYHVYSYGRFILMLGKGQYFTNSNLIDVERAITYGANNGIVIIWQDAYSSAQSAVLYDKNYNSIFYVKNTYTHGFKLSTYIQTENPSDVENYTLPSGASFSYVDARILKGRFFIGTSTGLVELTGAGQTTSRYAASYNCALQLCPKDNDIMITHSTSGSASATVTQTICIYHLDTDTYTEYGNDVFNRSGQVPFLPVKKDTYFNELVEGIYITSYSPTAVIYNSYTDTYEFIYVPYGITGTTYLPNNFILDNEYIVTLERVYKNDIVRTGALIIGKDGVYRFNDYDTTGISGYGISLPYSYDSKYYFSYYDSLGTTYKYFIICLDTINKTLTSVFQYEYQIFSSNFQRVSDGYTSISQNNLEIFCGYGAINDGNMNKNYSQVATAYCLIFNKTTSVWKCVSNNFSCYIWQDYLANTIMYRDSGTNLSIYNLDTDTLTTTDIKPANNSSAKYVGNGNVLVKQTTSLVKYNLGTNTSTQIVTSSNNTNSNNYGSIRVVDNIALVFTISGGWYNSTTDTFTSGVNANYYGQNYYNSITFTKLSNNLLMLHMGQGASSYNSYGTHQIINGASPSIDLSTISTSKGYSAIKYNENKTMIYYSTWSTSQYYHILYIYDIANDTVSTRTIYTFYLSSISYGDWFITSANGDIILLVAGRSSGQGVLHNVTRNKSFFGDLASTNSWWIYKYDSGVGILNNAYKQCIVKLDYKNDSSMRGMITGWSQNTNKVIYVGRQSNNRVYLYLSNDYTEADK